MQPFLFVKGGADMADKCPHEIQIKEHESIIRRLELDLAVAKSDIGAVKDEIKDIKTTLTKFNYWFLSILGTTILTLIGIIIKN